MSHLDHGTSVLLRNDRSIFWGMNCGGQQRIKNNETIPDRNVETFDDPHQRDWTIPAHRSILAASSSFWKRNLECKTGREICIDGDVDPPQKK